MEKNSYRAIKKVLFLLFFANIAVTAAKIIIGFITKSVALTADGFHSLSDSANNIIGIIGITLASRPQDKEHPYGHKKIETMASLLISMALVVMAYNVITKSIDKLYNPEVMAISLESLIILIATVIINIYVAVYEKRKGQEYSSSFLIADSIHTKSDVFVSISVIITLICIRLGLPPVIDIIISFVVSVFILKAAYDIFKEAMSVLMDKVVLTNEEVLEVVGQFQEIKNVHKIRSRGFEDYIFLDMHILVDVNLNVDEAHRLVHAIEEKLQEKTDSFVDVVIHVEPYYKDYGRRIKA